MVKSVVLGEINDISEEVSDFSSSEAKQIIEDLKDTYVSKKKFGCVGLACCQIGYNKRIILISDRGRVFIMVNPEIIYREGYQIGLEGCLSFPDIYAQVERSFKVKVKFQTPLGNIRQRTYSGKTARVLQHEYDHINGICKVGEKAKKKNEENAEKSIDKQQ